MDGAFSGIAIQYRFLFNRQTISQCDNITMVLANFRVIKTVDLIQLHLNTSSLGLRLSYLNKTLIITSSSFIITISATFHTQRYTQHTTQITTLTLILSSHPVV
jgi:hypothetical protein